MFFKFSESQHMWCSRQWHSNMGVSENSVPLNPMVLLIIIPIKWLFHWEYTQHFQTNPHVKCWCMLQSFAMKWLVLIIWHVCSFSKKPSKPVGKKWTGPGSSAIVREHQIGMLGIKSEHEHGIRCASEYVDGFELQNRMVSDSKRIGHRHFLSSTW